MTRTRLFSPRYDSQAREIWEYLQAGRFLELSPSVETFDALITEAGLFDAADMPQVYVGVGTARI